MNIEINNCLILSPHPDDMELACGGTVNKFNKVLNVVFSNCGIEDELKSSCEFLGIEYKLFNYEVRHLSYYRHDILQDLIDLDFEPDLVMLPSSFDIHQDHQTIYEQGKRAFKKCRILGYESCWNNFEFKCGAYSVLNKFQIDNKLKALSIYKSQQDKKYFAHDFIKGMARMRGTQIGETYAEGFEIIRWIL